MAVTLTGAGGLFTRIGHMGGTLNYINASRDQSFLDHLDLTRADYPTSDQTVTDQLYQQGDAWVNGQEGFTAFLASMGEETIIEMVQDDTQREDLNLSTALAELIRQMRVAAASVNKPAVTGTITYGNGVVANVGTGVGIVSVLSGLGVQRDYAFDESIRLICSADAQSGGATAGQESFTYTAERLISPQTFWQWPIGSGASGTVSCISAAQEQSETTNLLNNGGFEDFTANAPDNWTIVVGVAGTTVDDGGSTNALTGSNCLALIGNAAVLHNLTQTFGTAGQTTANLTPQIPYILSFWSKVSNNAATGTFVVKLVDSAGTTINDDAGTANSTTIVVDSETTTYANHSAVFRLPRDIPTTVKVSILFTSALSAHTLYVDELILTPATVLYDGGPAFAVVRGGVDWVLADQINLAVANNVSGTFFQGLFERLFSMRTLDLILPSTTSPTISDALIV